MMNLLRDWRALLGLLLGLIIGGVLSLSGLDSGASSETPIPEHGHLLSDCDGALHELVIQYVAESVSITGTPYREFLRKLPEPVTVYVVCPGEEDFADLEARVGPLRCSLVKIVAGHAMTCWSRDRWLAFAPPGLKSAALLVPPREEAGQDAWPQRTGDSLIAHTLATALPGRATAWRSSLLFDGGDFVADERCVFVTPRVAERNIGRTVATVEELHSRLESLLRRQVILLPEAPPHHAGMFMMLTGEGTALVGDPSLASSLLAGERPPLASADFSRSTQHLFDAVAAACTAHGYRVIRFPVVPDSDGRTYLTSLNAVIDERAGGRTVFMPVFRGAPRINEASANLFRNLGYQVEPIDCTTTYRHYGSLRCLVNVLSRG